MITDQITNASSYYGINPRIEAALQFLSATDLNSLEPGRYDIDGDQVFALVQDYNTKLIEDGFLEAHRKYIDVQFVAKGRELMGYTAVAQPGPYDEEKDLIVLEGQAEMLKFAAGTFMIFLAGEAHMPCIADGESSSVRKVVVKVAVE